MSTPTDNKTNKQGQANIKEGGSPTHPLATASKQHLDLKDESKAQGVVTPKNVALLGGKQPLPEATAIGCPKCHHTTPGIKDDSTQVVAAPPVTQEPGANQTSVSPPAPVASPKPPATPTVTPPNRAQIPLSPKEKKH
jgi:hypothetical protein